VQLWSFQNVLPSRAMKTRGGIGQSLRLDASV